MQKWLTTSFIISIVVYLLFNTFLKLNHKEVRLSKAMQICVMILESIVNVCMKFMSVGTCFSD